jgi:lipopolysaccharide export system protein LptA
VRRASGAVLGLVVMGAMATFAAKAQVPLLGSADNGKPIGISAADGIEWQQINRVYIARGHATATRGQDTVVADTLSAYYRPIAKGAKPPAEKQGVTGAFADNATEIYRLVADGHVRFATPTESVTGDHAVYDVDTRVLTVTGKDLRLTTPSETITARDSLEWNDATDTGVARGDAIATRADRRLRADVLTATFAKQPDGSLHVAAIDADGHVAVTTPGQIARGDKGAYDVASGTVTLSGNVRLTRGENELRGRYAVVDLNRNVSRLLAAPPGERVAGAPAQRVEGLFIPRQNPPSTGP